MYWTAGEKMTTSCLSASNPVLLHLRDAPKSLLDTSDVQVREELLDRLVDAKLMGPTQQLGCAEPSSLPTRELHQGNFAELYMVYISFCGGEQVASRACFYKEAKRWRQCLSFRRPLAHSVCAVCSKLQAALANASEPWRLT